MKKIITKDSKETKKLGKDFARSLVGGEIICLNGDLGSGKTTFTQGILEGLSVKGPYISPTFAIMKKYEIENAKSIYHIDTYRIGSADMLDLGWEEIIVGKNNIIIIEWPERIKDILTEDVLNIKFKWINENKRELVFNN